jgi:methylated-DNA-[protein]-cysteine S-methyltransferase
MKSVTMNSPAGSCRIFASDQGVTQIDFLEGNDTFGDEETDHPILLQAVRELKEYYAGTRKKFDVPLDLRIGTAFQREAWDKLREIPYGTTLSYGEQAKAMGRPKAVRAVGGANGKNPIPVIIPCHRVVSSLGKLHGFSGGLDLKRYLLSVEGLSIPK